MNKMCNVGERNLTECLVDSLEISLFHQQVNSKGNTNEANAVLYCDATLKPSLISDNNTIIQYSYTALLRLNQRSFNTVPTKAENCHKHTVGFTTGFLYFTGRILLRRF